MFIERIPKPGAVEAIQKRLAENIHVYFPNETRETRDIFYDIAPSKEQLEVKRALAKEYFYSHEDTNEQGGFAVEVKSAAALLVKLQQVSDGVVRNSEGTSFLIESPKARRFREIACELLDGGERVLVWVAFRRSLELLRDLLPGPVAMLSGDHPFDSAAWERGEAKICLATVGSGASLNDFAGVRYSIFYSSPCSHLQNQQARGRTLRASSDPLGRVYYHLCTEGFPDRRVLKMIEASRSTEEEVIEITRQVVAEAMREK
jgi:ERCC4-related helicase